jgi:hypothetical protein
MICLSIFVITVIVAAPLYLLSPLLPTHLPTLVILAVPEMTYCHIRRKEILACMMMLVVIIPHLRPIMLPVLGNLKLAAAAVVVHPHPPHLVMPPV